MKTIAYGNFFSFYLGAFAFVSLVVPKMVGLMSILMLVLVIVGYVKKELSWKLNRPGMIMMLLYAAYFIGFFFANELSNGLKYAEYKLSLLMIPLMLSVKPKFEFRLRGPVTGLILATVALMVIGLISATNCYSEKSELLHCFTSSNISPIHHPSYFCGFLLFADALAWYGYRKKWKGFSVYAVACYTILAFVFYLLCLSLAGLLFFGIVILALFIFLIYRKFGKWVALLVTIVGPFLIFLTLRFVPDMKEDISATTEAISEYVSNPQKFLKSRVAYAEIPGNQKRLIMWTVTAELIAEHPFGVGTGNVDDYLDPRLEKYNFHQLVVEDLNPHNQYLQTTLEIGFIGFILLFTLIITCIWIAVKYRSYLLLLLISGLAFNMLFESMLQRHSGVVFYTFWISVLMIVISKEKAKVIEKEGF